MCLCENGFSSMTSIFWFSCVSIFRCPWDFCIISNELICLFANSVSHSNIIFIYKYDVTIRATRKFQLKTGLFVKYAIFVTEMPKNKQKFIKGMNKTISSHRSPFSSFVIESKMRFGSGVWYSSIHWIHPLSPVLFV